MLDVHSGAGSAGIDRHVAEGPCADAAPRRRLRRAHMYKAILLTVDLGDAASWKKALPAATEIARESRGDAARSVGRARFRLSARRPGFSEGLPEECGREREGPSPTVAWRR